MIQCTLIVKKKLNKRIELTFDNTMTTLGLYFFFFEIWNKHEIDKTLLAVEKQIIFDQEKQEIYANIEN